MSAYYLDTSALAKRYVNETGSVWLRALIDPALRPLTILAQFALVETISVFNRRVREGSLGQADYSQVEALFRGDCLKEYSVIPLNQTIVDLACRLIERHPLRTLDALHLATSLNVQQLLSANSLPDLIFISADERLLQIAAAEKLNVDNPNLHP